MGSQDATLRSYCTYVHTGSSVKGHAFLLSCLVNTYSPFKTQLPSSNLPETPGESLKLPWCFSRNASGCILVTCVMSVFIASQRAPQEH